MSQGLKQTKGARLYFTSAADASSSDADGVAIFRVYCPTGIQNIGGGQKPNITVTCLDSGREEFKGGLPGNEAITVPFNVARASAAYQALIRMHAAGNPDNLESFMIVDPDENGDPGDPPTSVDSDGMLEAASGTTARAVMGYVANMVEEAALNDIFRGTLTIQTSGEWSNTFPDPTLP